MKFERILTVCLVWVSAYTSASEYRLYASDYSVRTKKENFAAYVLKGNPCITVYEFKTGKSVQYCDLGNKEKKAGSVHGDISLTHLQRDYPTVYVTDLSLWSGDVTFTVATPWSDLSCTIDVQTQVVSCE
ncbi:hypothetical protein EK599_09785 [Vibrio sp. T187]|uniref:hypothetical protein n=1 Tax=Vibrio TaxID=662 RepID=UPI0010C9562D|nr:MULTISPECIES: hypothetical protein [Vibrio]MBW3695987.1 hypothetical protein [Vibrio sp. T187]